ncbi:MAG: glycosyltransferase family 2 protein [Anaerolineae bacterium]|nr:glycosyltransferase family 2 protein [Anaerolineae bacterium]
MMPELTAVILTRNEEAYLPACIESLRWVDEIVVFDSGSTDRTVAIARELGATVLHHPFRDFASQRNAALDAVDGEWVLFLDADERATPALAAEVRAAIQDPNYTGWWIPCHTYLCGRLTYGAGMYPDYHLRLMRRGKARYDPQQSVHERVILEGAAGQLHNPHIHINCEDWRGFMEHQDLYAHYKARIHFAAGRNPVYHFVAGPLLEFWRRFVTLRGYRDGMHGLILSTIFAYYIFVMYIRLWKLQRASRRERRTAAHSRRNTIHDSTAKSGNSPQRTPRSQRKL